MAVADFDCATNERCLDSCTDCEQGCFSPAAPYVKITVIYIRFPVIKPVLVLPLRSTDHTNCLSEFQRTNLRKRSAGSFQVLSATQGRKSSNFLQRQKVLT